MQYSINDLLPEPEAVSIDQAFEELKRSSFALWIRMMTLSPSDMAAGRLHLARELGWSRDSFNVHVRDLVENGYIELRPSPGYPTKLVLLKVPSMPMPNYFIKYE